MLCVVSDLADLADLTDAVVIAVADADADADVAVKNHKKGGFYRPRYFLLFIKPCSQSLSFSKILLSTPLTTTIPQTIYAALPRPTPSSTARRIPLQLFRLRKSQE